ncbi:hypothetical protein LIER_26570 [Lithospermum erythrorhizon]|uniref:Calmodulin-binding domain-containing protein n=1 Tax=Lithospermum erythrorhizon TaxID=34254 RepID=A0AAV3R927_LITER
MAHEGDNSALDRQKSKLDGGASGNKSIKKTSRPIGNSSATHQRRASLGSSFNGDSSRSDSSRKFSSGNNKNDVIPHYLRASTGSCHDFCKYGRKHTVEEKPWHSFSKKLANTSSSKLRSKEHMISAERNKVTEEKHKPREPKTHAEDLNPSTDKPITQNSSGIIKNEVYLPSEDFNPSPDKTITLNSSGIIKNEVYLPSEEVELSPDKLDTAKDVQETKFKTSNMPSRHAPLLQLKAVKASPSSEISEGNLRKGRISSKIKDGELPQASNPSRSTDASQGELRRSRKHGDMKEKKTLAESKASQKEVLRPSDNLPSSMMPINKIRNLTSRKNSNSKPVPLKDRNIIEKAVNAKQRKNEKVSVKILNALEADTDKNLDKPIRKRGVAASSHKQDQIEENTIVCNNHDGEEGEGERDKEESGVMDDAATTLIMTNKDASKEKRKEGAESKITRTLRKGTPMISKNKDSSSPMKLNFRRGMVVQLHSDNSTPRRLKFKCGRILLGNKDGVADGKKIGKKKGVNDDKDVAGPSSKKVVLRHQDVQDKKIDPGLFNHVIEETASKLVGSRKSKVKALVGAFETVISLQESKPLTNAVS